MSNIVHIEITEHFNTRVVDARELHAKLGVGRLYNAWLQGRIEQLDMRENRDYWVMSRSGHNPNGGRPSVDTLVSTDMAEHLCMLERTEAGRKYRDYMISCRKEMTRVKAQPVAGLLDDPIAMAEFVIAAANKINSLKGELAVAEPKAKALDALCDYEGLHSVQEAAKELNVGQSWLFEFMRDHGMICKVNNTPYQRHTDAGRFITRFTPYKAHNGANMTSARCMVTSKGMVYLRQQIDEVSQMSFFDSDKSN